MDCILNLISIDNLFCTMVYYYSDNFYFVFFSTFFIEFFLLSFQYHTQKNISQEYHEQPLENECDYDLRTTKRKAKEREKVKKKKNRMIKTNSIFLRQKKKKKKWWKRNIRRDSKKMTKDAFRVCLSTQRKSATPTTKKENLCA